MRVALREIGEVQTTVEFEIPTDRFPVLREISRRGEAAFVGAVRSRLSLQRVSGLIEVEGRVRCTARLACARCLVEFDYPIEAAIRLAYARRTPETAPPGEPAVVDPEEADLLSFSGEELDLAEGVQEQIVLALPIRALCREECRGLCPRCGADWNQGPCGCPRETETGPFAALGTLKAPGR